MPESITHGRETMNKEIVSQELVDANASTQQGSSGFAAAASSIGVSALLSACGGGSEPDMNTLPRSQAMAVNLPAHKKNWRFLSQATFGFRAAEAPDGQIISRRDWINAQLLKRPKKTTVQWTIDLMNKRQVFITGPAQERDQILVRHHVTSAIWEQFLTGEDQLRQRVAYALSQILVVSFNSDLSQQVIALASYHDLLLKHAFGDFKALIKDVCKHPAMGVYLSHLRNTRPNLENSVPDQNFARELLQLFTIGLYELNMDGSLKRQNGQTMNTYTQFDIELLSYVFTGWGWARTKQVQFAGDPFQYTPRNRRKSDTRFADDRRIMESPMEVYADKHATKDDYLKVFASWMSNDPVQLQQWGITTTSLLKTPVNFSGVAADDLDAALKVILNHPNVAPFIAKQMIQRLVTSNPSPLYVSRVANAFKSSGLSLFSLVMAILTDNEAVDDGIATRNDFGKLKEPVLRMTAALRAFNAKPPENQVYYMTDTNAITGGDRKSLYFGQGPYQSGSVFNFYRPGYVPPVGVLRQVGLYAPEFQISSETEVAAYVRAVSYMARMGIGGETSGYDGNPLAHGPCLRMQYTDELNLLASGYTNTACEAVTALLSEKLLGGTMSSGLSGYVKNLLMSPKNPSAQALDRVAACVALVMISPEYVVQK
jgi:uncharacterized protein (DUF1800 family)